MHVLKRSPLLLFLAALLGLIAGTAQGQSVQNAHIAYVYPAGGQAGTTFEVAVGGKDLQKVESVQISGPGVNAVFVEHIANYKRKLQEQYRVIGRQNFGKANANVKERKFGPPPEHEMFTRLEELPEQEFRQVAGKFQKKESVQRNRELDELVILRISINPDAVPGMRELRLLARGGASNPVRFMVNTLPEAREYEPNDLESPDESHMKIPFIMNGQIMPGDEDRFSFDAIEGQRLVVHVKARELVPYLADAVPGWFQAVLAIHDDKGNEVAYADDFLFNPDPALLFEAPESGTYHLTIRDSIFRGREDFVYRVAVGEIPFVTGIFPLGSQLDAEVQVSAYGWNLDAPEFALDSMDGGGPVRRGYFWSHGTLSNHIRYAFGPFPESMEAEHNNSMQEANPLELQSTVNGRIDQPGDIDYYRFDVEQGQVIEVSINARRLYSPVDSLLRMFDAEGNVLAWNDDMPHAGNLTDRTGLLTHNSDSELEFRAPATGTYFIQVSDTQNKGGPTYAYRLSVSEPVPGFELYITPSVVTVPSGSGGKARLHVKRVNGFTGPIDIKLADGDSGLQLSGGRIPAKGEVIPVVLSSARETGAGLVRLDIEASAQIRGKTVTRNAIPADDITQAFITHHLVEAGELGAYVLRNFRVQPDIRLKDVQAVVLSAGEALRIGLKMKNLPRNASGPIFELESAPEGISLETKNDADGASIEFSASDALEPGQEGNLVVGVYFEITPKSKNGKRKVMKLSAGALPAIPFRTR